MPSTQREYATQLGLSVFYGSKSFIEAVTEYSVVYNTNLAKASDPVTKAYYSACGSRERTTDKLGIFE